MEKLTKEDFRAYIEWRLEALRDTIQKLEKENSFSSADLLLRAYSAMDDLMLWLYGLDNEESAEE